MKSFGSASALSSYAPETGFWEACQIGTDKSASRHQIAPLTLRAFLITDFAGHSRVLFLDAQPW
jgi:hypothetical protein